MKNFFVVYFILITSLQPIGQIKGYVNKETKEFNLTASIRKDY
jgi:hypothetical protein